MCCDKAGPEGGPSGEAGMTENGFYVIDAQIVLLAAEPKFLMRRTRIVAFSSALNCRRRPFVPFD